MKHFLSILFIIAITIVFVSLSQENNNIDCNNINRESIQKFHQESNNIENKSIIKFDYFTDIDSVIVKFSAPISPYNFKMKFTENGVYIKGKYNYSPINYAPQLASLVNQLYITKTTNIITEKRKYSGNIVAEYPILYVLIYKGKTIKETSTIFGEYQGNYKYTYSDVFKEFNRLLELCAFELIN